jgi:hypothetical protein
LQSETIAVRVMSGRLQPAPERWNVHLGQAVVLRIEGLGPPLIRVTGPGLPSSGLTNGGSPTPSPRLSFTPPRAGEYQVELVEAPATLGTLHVMQED